MLEWLIFTIGMIVGGVALLALFMHPLLALLGLALVGFVMWISGPTVAEERRRPRSIRGR